MSPFLARLVPILAVIGLLLVLVDEGERVTRRFEAFAAPGPAPAPVDVPAAMRQAADRPRPPLTPRWAYEPWVWEDEENTAASTLALVDGYRERGIPTGVVLVDSPWQTNYNTFVFNANYPDPAGFIKQLRDRNLRVVFWATGFVNTESNDGPDRDISPNYAEAKARGFLVSDGLVVGWDKGRGSAIDFYNPDAVAWWYAQMDKAWAYGIDGWKVDAPEGNLPDIVQTAAGPKTNREYGAAYYRAFYAYVAARSPDAITMARPVDGGTVYAPIDANPVGWVGDQEPDWGRRGIEEALDSILASAELGYSMLGSDIGGYKPGPRFDKLFIRWTQLGALSPLMENGGRGEHRPWLLDDDVAEAYRYYATLHHQLVPYFYGLGVEASRGGEPIVRDPDRQRRQYRLGEDLFVAPIVTREDRRQVALPTASRWHDFWDDGTIREGGETFSYAADVDRIPLFVRAGAIVPMQVSDGLTGHGGPGSAGALTLLLYPDGESRRVLRPDTGRELAVTSRRGPDGIDVGVGAWPERVILRIKEARRPQSVELTRGGAGAEFPVAEAFDAWERLDAGWYHDAARGYLWVRFTSRDAEARLRIR